jgi:hypothetical protein
MPRTKSKRFVLLQMFSGWVKVKCCICFMFDAFSFHHLVFVNRLADKQVSDVETKRLNDELAVAAAELK